MGRTTIRSMTVAALAALGLATGLGTVPSATAEELPGCLIWADAPRSGNGGITGVGHRDRCGQRRTITVRIREDISWLPDRTVAELTWTGVVNGSFPVPWYCPPGASGTYFTEILTSAGGKAQSDRRELRCFYG